MKELKLTKCYIVPSWAKEIEIATGFYLGETNEGFCSPERTLVLKDGKWHLFYSKDVTFNIDVAKKKLEKEKSDYKAFLQKEIKSYQESIAGL